MSGAHEPEIPAMKLTPAQENERHEWYKQNQLHEHHFNNLEMEIRELASAWLLAALGAIAFLVRGA